MLFRMVAKLSATMDEWQILARTLSGKTATVNLDSHESIQDPKFDIWLKYGTPLEHITLLHNGRHQDDSWSLEEPGLDHGCVSQQPQGSKEHRGAKRYSPGLHHHEGTHAVSAIQRASEGRRP